MHPISNAFRAAMNAPAQIHRLTGTVGNVAFDESNIVNGSFVITNQSTCTDDVVLGSCYVGELQVEFTGLNITWSNWIKKTITPSFGLKIGDNEWETVPLGVFRIAKATHTAYGVKIVAYDNMTKFDKKFKKSHFMNLSGMYNIIDQLCTDSGVILGMSQAQIEALPNGNRTGINVYGSTGKKSEFANDITTNRDLLFWVAQTLGCFATMNRAGQLEFRKYNQNVVDVITNEHRLAGATFEDYITHYIGIYMENLDDNTEDYYGYDTTALTQELNETSAEISADNDDIDDLNADKAEWDEKLAQGQCTQAEYDEAVAEINAQIKAKQKDIKQLTKRLSWLEKALQSGGDDGSDMVLGANPLTMAKNRTTRDSQRREILGALSDISYTPFSASVVCGCIYDLGDVIQFSGGLYNSSTDSFGCVMSYTYTHNGGTELEGYGVDPSVVVVRNKTQKSADRAQKNAINAKEVFNGEDAPPEDAKDGDVYVKTKKIRKNLYPLLCDPADIKYDNYDIFMTGTRPIESKDRCVLVKEAKWMEGGYYIFAQGVTFRSVYMNSRSGSPVIKIPITKSGKYTFHGKFKFTSTNRTSDVLGINFMYDTSDLFGGVSYETFARPQWGGGALNLSAEGDNWEEYTDWFTVPSGWASNGYFYLYINKTGATPQQYNVDGSCTIEIKEFYIIHESDSESDQFETVPDKVYNYIVDENTGEGQWYQFEFVNGVDNSTWGGLALDSSKIMHLEDYVMRAWYKADPPQIARDFSQFCVRYTGAPNASVTFAPYGGNGWSNVSVKRADDGTYALKCGGTKTAGTVTYYAYQITGLTSGKRYYFNFAADFGANAVFGDDNTKSLGVVFNTTGTISSDNYSGEPHTFNTSTLYESFYRSNSKRYYDFDFVASAATMYMCIVLGDLGACTTQLSFTEFVVSDSERKYIRKWYLYDTTEKAWLEYRPFGAGDDGGAVTIDSLGDLEDVSLNDLQNEQILQYNSNTGKWENADNTADTTCYHAAGSKYVAQLVSSLLVAANEGCVYDMRDSGETTADFVEGEGVPIRVGDNVGVVNTGTVANPVYKFDLLSGFVDLSDYYDSDTVDELLDAKADVDSLGDLASLDIDGSGSTKFLKGDGTWASVPAQEQADWSESDSTAADYIKNKPTKVSDFTNDSNFVADNPTFSESSTRANIASGESFATILGKIKKWFSDLKVVGANPSGTATNNLTKLGIDGTNYNVVDDDYQNDEKSFTTNAYSTSTHTFTSTTNITLVTIKGVLSALSVVFNALKTAINDHAGVLSNLSNSLSGKVTSEQVTFNELREDGHRFGDNLSNITAFTATSDVSNENTNFSTVKTVVNNLADYTEENVEIETLSDTTPYLYRQSPAIGTRMMENALVGASVVWNQLVADSGSDLSVTVTSGHKYIMRKSGTWTLGTSDGTALTGLTGGTDMVFDITQMFGTSVANAMTVETFRGLFPNSHYAYDSGSLQSVCVSGKKVVGKNLLELSSSAEKTNYGVTTVFDGNGGIKFSGTCTGSPYTINIATSATKLKNIILSFENNITNAFNFRYRIALEKNGTTIFTSDNIWWSSAHSYTYDLSAYDFDNIVVAMVISNATVTNGIVYPMIRSASVTDATYEPYTTETYSISQSPLRGVPQLVNDAIVYDGDVKHSDGTLERKYGIVDLGSLSWHFDSSSARMYSDVISEIKPVSSNANTAKVMCYKYIATSVYNQHTRENKTVGISTDSRIYVYDTTYTDAATFKTAMSGVYLIYELATQTTEQSTPFTNPQVSFVGGTEEFIDAEVQSGNRDFAVPVGHISEYKKLPPVFGDDYIEYLQEQAEEVKNKADKSDVQWKLAKNVTSTSGESVTIPSDAEYLLVVLFGYDNSTSYPYATGICNSAEIPYYYLKQTIQNYDFELHGTYRGIDFWVKYTKSSDKWSVSSNTIAAVLYR